MSNKILVMLTGGTICSFVDVDGHRDTDAQRIRIIDTYKQSDSRFADKVEFDKTIPLDILSENMTLDTWDVLLDEFRRIDYEEYKGVIVLHGTDTLAYTAAMLSVVLAGVPIPVIMVSSQLPLNMPAANGNANFKAAVELIMNNIAPNVYTTYRNKDNQMYLHLGAHLLQCSDYSEEFFSSDMTALQADEAKCKGTATWAGKTPVMPINKFNKLTRGVLKIEPYVGLDYSMFNLENVKAIVHGAYHSQTVCVGDNQLAGAKDSQSIITLLEHMTNTENTAIPVFVTPCALDAYKYVSTGEALDAGAIPVWGMTTELVYAKVLIGCSLGLSGKELANYVQETINYEKICD